MSPDRIRRLILKRRRRRLMLLTGNLYCARITYGHARQPTVRTYAINYAWPLDTLPRLTKLPWATLTAVNLDINNHWYIMGAPNNAVNPTPHRIQNVYHHLQLHVLFRNSLPHIQQQLSLPPIMRLGFHRSTLFLDIPEITALPPLDILILAQIQEQLNVSDQYLVLTWLFLTYRRHELITNNITNYLESVPRNSQRTALFSICELLQWLRLLPSLKTHICGLALTLKGKINRAGSARKQKLLWISGAIRRYDTRQQLYMSTAQARTPAGTLGLTNGSSFYYD